MWRKKTLTRRFGLTIHPSVTMEEAQECLSDHELMAKLFYDDAVIAETDQSSTKTTTVIGSQEEDYDSMTIKTTTYQTTAKGSKAQVRVDFKTSQTPSGDLVLSSHEHLDMGIDILVQWNVTSTTSSENQYPNTAAFTTTKGPNSTNDKPLLIEEMRVQIPRLVFIVFVPAIKLGQSVSVKTQLLAAVMEIGHRHSHLRNPGVMLREDIAREARESVMGVDLAATAVVK